MLGQRLYTQSPWMFHAQRIAACRYQGCPLPRDSSGKASRATHGHGLPGSGASPMDGTAQLSRAYANNGSWSLMLFEYLLSGHGHHAVIRCRKSRSSVYEFVQVLCHGSQTWKGTVGGVWNSILSGRFKNTFVQCTPGLLCPPQRCVLELD